MKKPGNSVFRVFIVAVFFLTLSLTASILTAQVDTTLVGLWSGIVNQPGFGNYSVKMSIDSLTFGQISGKTEYPSLYCEGSNSFVSNTDSLHIFSETITVGTGSCGDGRLEIYKIEADSIQWNWYLPAGSAVMASGKLGRMTTGIQNIGTGSLKVYRISEIYPNPFQDYACFDVEVNRLEIIHVELYDMVGRKIQTIYHGTLQPAKHYTFKIDGEYISGGCYILQTSGLNSQASKMVFLSK